MLGGRDRTRKAFWPTRARSRCCRAIDAWTIESFGACRSSLGGDASSCSVDTLRLSCQEQIPGTR